LTCSLGRTKTGTLHDKGFVYTLWQEQTVAVFAVDLEARGVEIQVRDNIAHTAEKAASAGK
jgi:hypothetical protein